MTTRMMLPQSAPKAQPSRKTSFSDPSSSLAFSLQALCLRHEEYAAAAEKDRQDLRETIEKLRRRTEELIVEKEGLQSANVGLREEVERRGTETERMGKLLEEEIGRKEKAEEEVERLSGLVGRMGGLEGKLGGLEGKLEKLRVLVDGVEVKQRVRKVTKVPTTLNVLVEEQYIEPVIPPTRPFDDDDENKENPLPAKETFGKHTPSRQNFFNSTQPPIQLPTPDFENASVPLSVLSSTFVSNLLRENAAMQLNMAKQAEAISRLQDEVERLREQVTLPPLAPSFTHSSSRDIEDAVRRQSLTTEHTLSLGQSLGLDEAPLAPSRKLLQEQAREVHVHHHYHGAPAVQPPSQNTLSFGRSKSQSFASRPGPRRFPVAVPPSRAASTATARHSSSQPHVPARLPLQPISNNVVTSNRDMDVPTTPVTTLRARPTKFYSQQQQQQQKQKSPGQIQVLSSKRYSTSSSRTSGWPQTSSSPCSSPWSAVFDRRGEAGGDVGDLEEQEEFSRPTSSGSSVVWMPKRQNDGESFGYGMEKGDGGDSIIIKEVDDDVVCSRFRPAQLHRAPSLLSISGMDIHTSSSPPATARFSPSSTSSLTGSFHVPLTTSRHRLHPPLAAHPSPAILTTTQATMAKPTACVSSATALPIISSNQQQETKTTPDPNAEQLPPTTLPRSTLGRSTSMPSPSIGVSGVGGKSQEKETSGKQTLERVEEKPYAPLVDTFGKRVGGWLTGTIGGGGGGSGSSGSSGSGGGGAPKSGRKRGVGMRRAVSDFARSTSSSSVSTRRGPASIDKSLLLVPSSSYSSSTVPTSTDAAASEPTISEPPPRKIEDNVRRLRSAGIDPVNGLPALRQVSGVVRPVLLGGVDEEALRECLGDGL